jgi:Phospholipase_D-nuclease N-terminal
VLGFVIVYLVPIALAIFGVVDCLLTPRPYVRAMPKPLWILLIVLLYVVGPLLWIVAGRAEQPVRARNRPQRRITDIRDGLLSGLGEPGTHQARPGSDAGLIGGGRAWGTDPNSDPGPESGAGGRSIAPDDDPEFLRRLGEQLRRDRPEG